MTLLKQVSDFIFGVLLLGATPILIFSGMGYVASRFLEKSQFLERLFLWCILPLAFISFLMVCKWRKLHRSSPVSFFPLEVVLGVVFGLSFIVVWIAASYAAVRAD